MEVTVEPGQPVMVVAALHGEGVAPIPTAATQAPPSRIVTEDDDEMTFADVWDDDEWPRQFGAAGLGIP